MGLYFYDSGTDKVVRTFVEQVEGPHNSCSNRTRAYSTYNTAARLSVYLQNTGMKTLNKLSQ